MSKVYPYIAGAPTGYNEGGASRKKNSLRGFTAQSFSPRSDIDLAAGTLRQRSRMLYMTTPAATSAIKTSRTNVIGAGLKFKCRIDADALGLTEETADEWQKRTESEFSLWADDKRACDATGLNNFYELQQLAYISKLLSGDAFVLFKHYGASAMKPYSLRLHIIEADRVCTPFNFFGTFMTTGINEANGNYVYDGVEVDKNGQVVAYHVCNLYPDEFLTVDPKEWVRIPAEGAETGLPNIIQLSASERPDQYRGVPLLAQIIEVALQGRRYTEAELMAAVVQSYITTFVTTTADPTQMPFNEVRHDGEVVPTLPDDYQLGPGQINVMKPGENITTVTPTHPTTGFPEFMNYNTRQIGMATEQSGEKISKKYDSSYSAARAANNEDQKGYKMQREWFVNDFCRPVYERWLFEAVASGRIVAPGFFDDPIARKAWLGSDWIGPGDGMLDPLKEVQAEIAACLYGFSDYEQSTIKLNGSDWTHNAARLLAQRAILGLDNTAQDTGQTDTTYPSDEEETNE